ncbi:MAG: DUF1552 domain-containing protein [Myxococcota bacterium]
MKLVGRRNFLRGLGLGVGAAAITPFVRGLLQRAAGQASTHRRFVMMHTMNGLGHRVNDPVRRWRPSGPVLRPDTLAASHAPLAPWASKMLIVDELHNPFNNGQHGCGHATLSVRGSKERIGGGAQSWDAWPNPTGISLDVYMGQRLSEGQPHSRISWFGDVEPMSADASRNKVSSFGNTTTAFTQLFGSFDPGASDGEIEQRMMRGMSVLDTLRGDLTRLRSRLAPAERASMDQFEGAIRETEMMVRGAATGGMSCTAPGQPAGLNAGSHNGVYSPEYIDVMVQLQIAALQCNLTSVAIFNPVVSRRYYTNILGNWQPHNLAHTDEAAVSAEADLVRLDQFNASLLARYIEGLEAVSEDGGTMADNTLFAWYDRNGGVHHSLSIPHRHNHHPLITIGNPNGTYDTGRYVNFPQYRHCVSDGFVSMLNAVGIEDSSFGDPSECKGPLPLG